LTQNRDRPPHDVSACRLKRRYALARFQGNVNAGSDRAAATVLFMVLLAILLLVVWWLADPAGFAMAMESVKDAID
jgi:hypothetical protein